MKNSSIAQWFEAWPHHIFAGGPAGTEYAEQMLEVFDPAGVYEDVAYDLRWTGRDGLKDMFDLAFGWCPNAEHHTLTAQTDGKRFAIEWRLDGVGGGAFAGRPPHDRPFSFRGVSAGEVSESGLIARHSDYWNEYDWLKQCGYE